MIFQRNSSMIFWLRKDCFSCLIFKCAPVTIVKIDVRMKVSSVCVCVCVPSPSLRVFLWKSDYVKYSRSSRTTRQIDHSPNCVFSYSSTFAVHFESDMLFRNIFDNRNERLEQTRAITKTHNDENNSVARLSSVRYESELFITVTSYASHG